MSALHQSEAATSRRSTAVVPSRSLPMEVPAAPSKPHTVRKTHSSLRTNLLMRPHITTLTLIAASTIFVLLGLAHLFVVSCPTPAVLRGAFLTREEQTDFDHEPASLSEALTRWKDPDYAAARLKVFVYDLPPRFNTKLVDYSNRNPSEIRDPYCDRNFYSSEVHVHRFFLSSSVRTLDPSKADFFYVPIYTTCDLIHIQPNDLDRVGRNFASAMHIVKANYPYWNATDGRDHVFLFSQGFSARLAGDWTQVKNAIFMVHNGEYSAAEYTPRKDFVIPPELRAYFEPVWRSDPDGSKHVRKTYLAQFGGQVIDQRVSDHRGSNYSGGVRQFIRNYLRQDPMYRITGVRSPSYLQDMRDSKFCLAPEGWHPWSPRPYYSVLMGCIPVIISEVQELAFEEFFPWGKVVIWIRPKDIHHLDKILRSVSDADIARRRKAMKEVWKVLWYAGDGLGYQAILRSLYIRKYIITPQRVYSTSVHG